MDCSCAETSETGDGGGVRTSGRVVSGCGCQRTLGSREVSGESTCGGHFRESGAVKTIPVSVIKGCGQSDGCSEGVERS